MLAVVDDAQLAVRFGAIEQQLRLISEHLGLDGPSFVGDTSGSEGSPAESSERSKATSPLIFVSPLARASLTSRSICAEPACRVLRKSSSSPDSTCLIRLAWLTRSG